MGLLSRLFGSEPEYDASNPFVANEPWEWPDDSEYDFDSHDDPNVEYAFEWSQIEDDDEIYLMHREKINSDFTRFTIVLHPADQDEDEFGDEATGMHVMFYGTEQIWGDTRTYEYTDHEDGPGEIDVSIKCYNNTFSMPRTMANDLYLPFEMTEALGEDMVEHAVRHD